MNKKILKVTLNTLLWVGLAVTLVIAYGNINNLFWVRFVVAYMVFLLVYVLYFSITKLLQMRSSSREQRTKIMGRFLREFFITFLLLIIADALFKRSSLNVNGVVTALCIAFGVSFGSIAINNDKSNC